MLAIRFYSIARKQVSKSIKYNQQKEIVQSGFNLPAYPG